LKVPETHRRFLTMYLCMLPLCDGLVTEGTPPFMHLNKDGTTL